VDKFADYVTDVTTFVKLAKGRERAAVYVLGHSAGGVVCASIRSNTSRDRGAHLRKLRASVPAPDFALAF